MSEAAIMAAILRDCGALPGVRLFRNQVGNGFVGNVVERSGSTVTLANARQVSMGWCPDSSDILGCVPRDGIAQLVAMEVKTETGRVTPGQRRFLDAVRSWGGLSAVVRSPEHARALLLGNGGPLL